MVTILNVDPGGYCPVSARSAWSIGVDTTARMAPLPSMATTAAGWVTPASADWAAAWATGSMVVFSGLGGVPGNACSTSTVAPDASTACTSPAGVPASDRS